MKQVILLLLFNFIFFFAPSQNNKPIYISAWINKPMQEDFSKPLIFIDFWATWCGPCISSMSYTESLSEHFKDNVLFLYISEEPTGRIKEFMNKRNKNFFSATDNTGNNVSNFNVKSLPHSMLIDPQGKVIWEGNPSSMTKKRLSKFVELYKYNEGNINRIVKAKVYSKKVSWNIFKINSDSIKYIEIDNAINELSKNKNEFYLSGDIKYFFSIVKGIPLSQIKTEFNSEKKYILSSNANNIDTLKETLNQFLIKECKVSAYKEKVKQKTYILKDTSTENFFNKNMYNFENGNNAFLADDLSILIDNATIEEMAETLSTFSDHNFKYHGKNQEVYDWNIHYKFNKLTLDQLRNELNFLINEEEQEVIIYTLKIKK